VDEHRAAHDRFRLLVDERGQAMQRSAYLLTGDWGAAEDLLQSALAITWTRWSSLRDPQAAEAYARRTMARLSTRRWRRRWHGERPTEVLPEQPVDGGMSRVDDQALLAAALRELPPRQRAVVVLRFFDDLSEADTAAALGCAVGTVKSSTSRALARLRELLGEAADAPLVEGPA
jgi:RNA polymerase sigma-70 factor (ECF subfamily)